MTSETGHVDQGYTRTARVFHWATAALVLMMLPIGIVMANVDVGSAQNLLYHLHRSIGVVLLPLMIARLVYRLRHPPPPLPAEIPVLQRRMANLVHRSFYALLMLQALLGWMATSAYRAPILVFWLFELPPILPVDRPLSEALFAVHRTVGIALAVLLAIHIGAALFHHFVRRDRVLLRMVRG
jgi:cytochrome b561